MTDIEYLKSELHQIHYPANMKEALCEIKGKGFFPGARGLWEDRNEALSGKSAMILGHDFGTQQYYDEHAGDNDE